MFNKKGSVSMFMAMIFLLVVSVVITTIESARIQGAKVMLNTVLAMGMDSVFAEYDRELFSQFGVLLMDASNEGDNVDPEYLSALLNDYMQYNLYPEDDLLFARNTDLYDIELYGIKTVDIVKPMAAGGLIWQDMVVGYEKYAKVIDLSTGFFGLEDVSDEAEAVERIGDEIVSVSQKIMVVNETTRDVIENIDGVLCPKDGMNIDNPIVMPVFVKRFCPFGTTMDGMNIPYQTIVDRVAKHTENPLDYIDEAVKKNNKKKSCKNEINNLIGLVKNCSSVLDIALEKMDIVDSKRDEIDTQLVCLDSFMSEVEEIIEEDTMEGINKQYERLCEYDEILLKDICDVVTMRKTLIKDKQIFADILTVAENIKSTSDYDQINILLEQTRELILDFSYEGMRFEYENLRIAESDMSLLDEIKEFFEVSYLSIVIPAGETISLRRHNYEDLASAMCDAESALLIQDESIRHGDLNNIVTKNLIYLEYIMDNFVCFTNVEPGTALDYEIEYILYGHSTDMDNLTRVVLDIASLRSGVNMIYLIQDDEKMEATYNTAVSLVGAAQNEALNRIVQFLILYLWAYGEALMDIRTLFKGDEIAVYKTDETWQLSLNNLMEMNFSDPGIEQEGINYEIFLRYLLFTAQDGEKAEHTMDLVELWMINNGREDFRLNKYIYGMDVTVTYEVLGKYMYEEKAYYTY